MRFFDLLRIEEGGEARVSWSDKTGYGYACCGFALARVNEREESGIKRASRRSVVTRDCPRRRCGVEMGLLEETVFWRWSPV